MLLQERIYVHIRYLAIVDSSCLRSGFPANRRAQLASEGEPREEGTYRRRVMSSTPLKRWVQAWGVRR